MNIVEKLIKLAEDLEKEGFIEEADELTDAVEKSLPQQAPQSNDVPEVVVDNPQSQSIAIPKAQDNMVSCSSYHNNSYSLDIILFSAIAYSASDLVKNWSSYK